MHEVHFVEPNTPCAPYCSTSLASTYFSNSANLLVGVGMIFISLICLLLNVLVIREILADKSMMQLNSYKLIVALALSGITQLVAHFFTGFFTIFQSTWSPTLGKLIGVLATPSYVLYTVLTAVLALNRLVLTLSPNLDVFLFSKRRLKIWFLGSILIFLAFAIALVSPYASIVYSPADWFWAYDTSREYSRLVQRLEMYIEMGCILVSGLIYAIVFGLLVHKRKTMKTDQEGHSASLIDVKILVQAFCITAYCAVLNLLWHNYESLNLSHSRLNFWLLNLMWINNSAINPLAYWAVNAVFHQRMSTSITKASSLTPHKEGLAPPPNTPVTKAPSAQAKQQGHIHVININNSMPNLQAVKNPAEGSLFHKKTVKNMMKQLHTDSTRKVLFLT